MVDESQQYDSLEAYRKQPKQPKEHIPLEAVLEYNSSATFEEDYTETSFHSSDDSN